MPTRKQPPTAELGADDPEDLRSRTDARKERLEAEDALMELAEALVKASERLLPRLDLPEDLVDAIRAARQIRAPSARKRAVRLVRSALRSAEPAQIRKWRASLG